MPEFMFGKAFEHHDDSEVPLIPRQSLDVRVLDFETARGPLRFVESDSFQLLVSAVIVANIAVIIDVGIHPNRAPALAVASNFILVFYIIELLLRMLHFRRRFFIGRPLKVLWNWIDLFIVSVGLLSRAVYTSHLGNHSLLALGFFRVLRVLRLLRLLRIARLVYTVLTGDFRWVGSAQFQWFGGLMIVLNAMIMGLETEIESPVWWWPEQLFLLFFLFEVIARVRLSGLARFFVTSDEKSWNIFDVLIVLIGVLDQWVLPVLQDCLGSQVVNSGGIGRIITTIRMFRLLRILRLLRLVKAVRPLYVLAIGIAAAFQGMFWVLVLTIVSLYAFAILATRLFGQGMAGGAESIDPETRALFADVLTSMFTLFGLMNGQYWEDVSPLFHAVPWTKPVWIVFTIISSWSLLSVMTGVVSDNMLETRQRQADMDNENVDSARAHQRRILKGMFKSADKDLNGTIERREYMDLLNSRYHISKLRQISTANPKDLKEMYDWIDVDGSGSIDFNEFLVGFDWLTQPVTGKSLLKLESTVKSRMASLERRIECLRSDMRRAQYQRERDLEEVKWWLQQAKEKWQKEARLKRQEAESAEASANMLRRQLDEAAANILGSVGIPEERIDSGGSEATETAPEPQRRPGMLAPVSSIAARLRGSARRKGSQSR